MAQSDCSFTKPSDRQAEKRVASFHSCFDRQNRTEKTKSVGYFSVAEMTMYLYSRHWSEWDPWRDVLYKTSTGVFNELTRRLWGTDGTAVFEAAKNRDENTVALALYTSTTAPLTRDEYGRTLLHHVVYNCSAKLVRLVVSTGDYGKVEDYRGVTPLHLAAQRGDADVLAALLCKLSRCEMHHPYKKTGYASLPCDNINFMTNSGEAPLHAAVKNGNLDALVVLLETRGIDRDQRRLGDGYTPLHLAIKTGNLDVVKACLDGGCDTFSKNYRYESPIQLAWKIDREDVVYMMINDYGENVNHLTVCFGDDADDADDAAEP